MKENAPRLFIVSNRLPYRLTERNNKLILTESDGGLVSSLKSYFNKEHPDASDAERVWVGSADFPESRWQKYLTHNTLPQSFRIEPLFIESREYNSYYNGFCNATIWPLFHYFPSYAEYSDNTYRAYEQVNQKFADRLAEIMSPGDLLWVHDYQLMLVPGMVREKVPGVRAGFFLHIPFPSYEIFRLLHSNWRSRILNGILGSDLVGFHTDDYARFFLEALHNELGLDHHFWHVEYHGRDVNVSTFPISIDYEKFSEVRETRGIRKAEDTIKSRYPDCRIIFSVDRLDYTKGITHRLSGFERFLTLHPEWHEKIVFILVVIPSRQIISKYNERKRLIDELVSRINGKYSSLEWQPIHYRYNPVTFDELSVLYRSSDIALITPLRDGMNLVAKEFVASRSEQSGVLILSELAGAAFELPEALLVNPTDKVQVAQSIADALAMTPDEQKRRMAQMQARIKKYNVTAWVRSFLSRLNEITLIPPEVKTLVDGSPETQQIQSAFENAERRLLLIDYDGTLAPFVSDPEKAIPSQEVLDWIGEVTADERNEIVLISGRSYSTLSDWFGDTHVGIVASHGAIIKRHNASLVDKINAQDIMDEKVMDTMTLYTDRVPGSFIEKKHFALAWHYRDADPEVGLRQSRELFTCLSHLAANSSYHVVPGNKVIEVKQRFVNKGAAAIEIVNAVKPDFVAAIGDDFTDEDMFAALGDDCYTIKVGGGQTCATYRIEDQHKVLSFLRKFVHPVPYGKT